LSDPAVIDRVGKLLKSLDLDLLAGGPPCQPFSKAGRSMIRHQVRHGLRESHDRRRDLWRSYLDIIRASRPRAVIMENVPDMALDREMFILRTMVLELEKLGYSVEERVVESKVYGIPQFRQRLILVAIRDGLSDRLNFTWPVEAAGETFVEHAIGDLPAVEPGWRTKENVAGWMPYDADKAVTSFQKEMRKDVPAEDAGRVYDHITRQVRDDDREAFALMGTKTRYSDLPEEFRRYRHDIFDDKYKRLDAENVSRTITAHIAKDGYWYIHPYQDRTITVREAARLQTFPDWFRFAGPPTAALRQIGNAVPPMLGKVLGDALITSLQTPVPVVYSSEEIASCLAGWKRANAATAIPWLDAETRWQAISAEILLDRAAVPHVRHVWGALKRWTSPDETVAAADALLRIGVLIDRTDRAEALLALARVASDGEHHFSDEDLAALVSSRAITQSQADIAALAVPFGGEDTSEEPVVVTKGVLRVVARLTGEKELEYKNKLTDGRLAVARTIGFGSDSREAHTALMELAARVCRPRPECTVCPVERYCASSEKVEQLDAMLPFG
jgi:DNA (cytosine-5)-methyltransferase 1